MVSDKAGSRMVAFIQCLERYVRSFISILKILLSSGLALTTQSSPPVVEKRLDPSPASKSCLPFANSFLNKFVAISSIPLCNPSSTTLESSTSRPMGNFT